MQKNIDKITAKELGEAAELNVEGVQWDEKLTQMAKQAGLSVVRYCAQVTDAVMFATALNLRKNDARGLIAEAQALVASAPAVQLKEEKGKDEPGRTGEPMLVKMLHDKTAAEMDLPELLAELKKDRPVKGAQAEFETNYGGWVVANEALSGWELEATVKLHVDLERIGYRRIPQTFAGGQVVKISQLKADVKIRRDPFTNAEIFSDSDLHESNLPERRFLLLWFDVTRDESLKTTPVRFRKQLLEGLFTETVSGDWVAVEVDLVKAEGLLAGGSQLAENDINVKALKKAKESMFVKTNVLKSAGPQAVSSASSIFNAELDADAIYLRAEPLIAVSALPTLVHQNTRRLGKLLEQKAIYGVSTPPQILMEIETILEQVKITVLASSVLYADGFQNYSRTRWNLKNIRTLLTEGFADTEIREMCQVSGVKELVAIDRNYGSGTSKATLIHEIIDTAERNYYLSVILAWAKEKNGNRYMEHMPYWQ